VSNKCDIAGNRSASNNFTKRGYTILDSRFYRERRN